MTMAWVFAEWMVLKYRKVCNPCIGCPLTKTYRSSSTPKTIQPAALRISTNEHTPLLTAEVSNTTINIDNPT